MDDESYKDMYRDEEMSPEMAKKRWSPGFLYIMDYGDGQQFKIGITSGDPENRLYQITRGAKQLLPNPLDASLVASLEMYTNPYYLEQLLHMTHIDRSMGGEWFLFETPGDLADLLKTIKPFGELKYYDRWYSYFKEDFLSYVLADALTEGMDYSRSVRVSMYNGKYHVRLNDDNIEELNKVVSNYREARLNSPETFSSQVVEVDFRTHTQQQAEHEKWFKNVSPNDMFS